MKFLIWKWYFGMCRHFCCLCEHKTICTAKKELKLNCTNSCYHCINDRGYCVMMPTKKLKKPLLFKAYLKIFKK